MNRKRAIYPGSFDPITFGHIDIIRRAAKIFDYLVVAVAKDNNKNSLFSVHERIEIARNEINAMNLDCEVVVLGFEGLLVDFAEKCRADVIVRGLRAVSDFEYEFQMFGMNARLNPNVQTIFLPASENNHFIASKLVKEAARLGGDISGFVSEEVADRLYDKLGY